MCGRELKRCCQPPDPTVDMCTWPIMREGRGAARAASEHQHVRVTESARKSVMSGNVKQF